jgi:phospholipid/cholesterol/gamma-HCH transport system substrate-binding protein
MSSKLSWADLKIGIAAASALIAIVVSILLFARVGALHGDTKTIYVTAPNTNGVLAGTEVWLAGQKVGLVKTIRFRPVTTDTLHRLVIQTDILANRMELLRRDSYADIRPGGNLIGSEVVYLSAGTNRARALKNGDTLATRMTNSMTATSTVVDTLGNRLNNLADSTRKMLARFSDPSGSIGAFRSHGIGQLNSASAIASSIHARATRGNGSIGLAYRGRVPERISRVFAQKDSIMLLLSSGNGSVGRFRRDSTLPRKIASVRASFDSLRALLSNPHSEVARFRNDTSLKSELARTKVQLDSLMKDVKAHKMRYINF